ncbi:MAG: 30S ribosomal protein S4, partial [Clostridia bacterium]|nr:30S ribosomal protein S4 [Clostridia bacterium]
GEIMLQYLERRLDNVVFRMGFAATRREARQLVNHGHFNVNGKRCYIPSAMVKPGDVVAVCQKSQASVKFKTLLEEYGKKTVPQWIEKAPDAFEGKIVAMPSREDIDYEVSENLIVELYSR